MKLSVPPGLAPAKSSCMLASVVAANALPLLLGAWTPAPVAGGPLFSAPFLSFNVGIGPISVAIADLNGDGRPDMAVANSGSNTVSVLLGNRDGTFGTRTDFTAGVGPSSVAIADLNGDGRSDLAVANYSGTVSVLLGNGDGTFRAEAAFDAGSGPSGLASADLNGDGEKDIVDSIGGIVRASLNQGNLTFASPITSTAPAATYTMV